MAAAKTSIFRKYFQYAGMLASKTFDNPRSIIFRKHQAMWNLLADSKPSSQPTAGMVERSGAKAMHHVLWLKEEGNALRESSAYITGKRGRARNEKNELVIRRYANALHKALANLKAQAI